MVDVEGRVSRAAKIPDVTVELMYSQRGPAYASMMLSNVSLPIPRDQKNRQDHKVSAKLVQANAACTQVEVSWRNMVGQTLGKRETL